MRGRSNRGKKAVDVGGAGVVSYEDIRAANIARNAKALALLGLTSNQLAAERKANKPAPRSKKRDHRPSIDTDATPRTKSLRLQNKDADGKELPEQPRPKTYMEEQAEARPDRAAFEGTLPMGNTPHDPDYNEPDDIEQRTAGLTALQAMARKVPKSGQGKGTAKPAKAFGLREEDVIKVVKDRIFSMAVHPSTEQTVFAGDKWGHLGVLQADGEVAGFHPHVRPITSIVVHPRDPAKVLTCSYDGTARMMDVDAGRFTEVVTDCGARMYGIDVSDKNAVYGALSDGAITITDVRAGPASTTRIQLHDKKVAHLHLNPGHPHLLATSSHDNTVAVWDVRKMSGGKKGKADPLSRLAHGKGVNAAYWSPITGNHLLSTCNDDRLRCYEDIVAKLGSPPKPRAYTHNNHTGRWLTPFKALWDPRDKTETVFVCGSMEKTRGVDVYSAQTIKRVGRLTNADWSASVQSLYAFHPTLPLLAGGNSSGRVYLWRA